MNYRVVIHDMAKDDIRRKAQWWADKHSRIQAEKWFNQAFDSIEKLLGYDVSSEGFSFWSESQTEKIEEVIWIENLGEMNLLLQYGDLQVGQSVSDRSTKYQVSFAVDSYWSVVIPLTMLSAWLLISKPRTKPVAS